MFEVYDVALIPLILGIVELFKIGGMKAKYSPFVAVFFGIVFGVVYIAPTDWKQGIVIGLAIGLGASGLYSSSKNLMEKSDE